MKSPYMTANTPASVAVTTPLALVLLVVQLKEVVGPRHGVTAGAPLFVLFLMAAFALLSGIANTDARAVDGCPSLAKELQQ